MRPLDWQDVFKTVHDPKTSAIVAVTALVVVMLGLVGLGVINHSAVEEATPVAIADTVELRGPDQADEPVLGSAEELKTAATFAAREFVKNYLKAPRDAEFAAEFEKAQEVDQGSWIVTGFVDSQNELGVFLRSSFECGIGTSDDNRDFVLKYLFLNGQVKYLAPELKRDVIEAQRPFDAAPSGRDV